MTNANDPDADFFDRMARGSSDALTPTEEETVSEGFSEEETRSHIKPQDGRFSPELRRALVELMRAGVVLANSKPQVYEQLCRHQREIDEHLANMYLRMLVDDSAGIALLLQQQDDACFESDEESSALISRRTLSLYDTLLLLVLRKHYQERQTAGEQQIIIDVERIESQLTPFLPLTNSSRSDRRKLNSALTKMKEKKLLSAIRGDDERFEITPVIRYVVNAEFLERMLTEYESLAGKAAEDTQP